MSMIDAGVSQQQQQQKQQQEQAQQSQRSKLVARLLAGTPSLPAFMNDLLTVQAIVVAGTEAAGFIIDRTPQPPASPAAEGQAAPQNTLKLNPVAHVRPDGADESVRNAALDAFRQIVMPCVEAGKDGALLIEGSPDNVEPQFCLVTLLRNENDLVAVSAVITRARDVERAQQRLVSMQLVAGYFDMFMLRRNAETARTTAMSHQNVLQLATAVATGTGFKHSATSLCNELQTRTGATRVSLGWVQGRRVRLKAISHTEQFDKKQEAVILLERVMEECADQEEIVTYDPDKTQIDASIAGVVTREAAVLSRKEGNVIVVSAPLRNGPDVIGVITLEFPPKTQLTPQTEQGLVIASELLAPQIKDRYDNDRWLITKAGISARETWKGIIGPKYWTAKTVVAIIAALLLFVFLYRPMYRVVAPFELSTIDKRVVAAPFEGLISELGEISGTRVRAGMNVSQGDVLLRLDTRELQLELARAMADAEKALTEAKSKRAEGKEAEGIMSDQAALAALAQADLIRYRLERAEVRAPITGEILKSDVTDKRGAPVKIGDPLFEIAAKDKLRVQLAVAERDIQRVFVGQKGHIATNALPGKKFPITVERIVPMGEAKEGANVFKVFATLDDASPDWRPGMAGEARLDTQHASLAWQWSHRLIDFIRLKLWI